MVSNSSQPSRKE